MESCIRSFQEVDELRRNVIGAADHVIAKGFLIAFSAAVGYFCAMKVGARPARVVTTAKTRKARVVPKSPGTSMAAAMRADANKLTAIQREKLRKEFLKQYYAGEPQPVPTRRR